MMFRFLWYDYSEYSLKQGPRKITSSSEQVWFKRSIRRNDIGLKRLEENQQNDLASNMIN
jgi:hypothetical protein